MPLVSIFVRGSDRVMW